MSGSTINTTIDVGIAMGSAGYPSPLTIASTSAVEASSGNAVYALIANPTLVNQGTVVAISTAGIGVALDAGGSVSNAVGGLIQGGTLGVALRRLVVRSGRQLRVVGADDDRWRWAPTGSSPTAGFARPTAIRRSLGRCLPGSPARWSWCCISAVRHATSPTEPCGARPDMCREVTVPHNDAFHVEAA